MAVKHTIRCRARLHRACYDGRPTATQFGDDLPMTEDGTFRSDPPGEGSIVCDACYVVLIHEGYDLHRSLEEGIRVLRERQGPGERHGRRP